MPTTSEYQHVVFPGKIAETSVLVQEGWSADAAEEAFRLLEGRWKMLILFHLSHRGSMRFSELERAMPLVSQKMLIQQLRDLEAKAIIERKVHREVPPRVEYCLTDLGLALRPALHGLVQWATFRKQRPLQEC